MTNWVLIPCHNNSDLLQACLISVLKQTIPVRIFAINNGSTDNTAQVLAGLGNEHIVVNAYPQLGVAGAWNYGLTTLFTRARNGGDSGGILRALVINQDVILRPDTYEILNNEPGDFVTAVSVGRADQILGPLRNPVGGKRPHPDFSCFRITNHCYQTVGPFDEGFYPAYAEDCDYHIRMHRAGIEAYCIDLPFFHHGAATINRAEATEKVYLSDCAGINRERFFAKWGARIGVIHEYEALFDPATFGVDIPVAR